jgi:peptidoglycan/xylan/chitin deacetylase (PgdA/CDA1 family)
MVSEGHELGSHSFSHPRFAELSPLKVTQELTYTEAAIAWALGHQVPLRFFSFPYARGERAAGKVVAALGYQSAFWDLDPRGWDPDVSSEDVVSHIDQHLHAGAIVIMHCSSWDDAIALPKVIRTVYQHQLTPGTLSDALRPEDRNIPGY